MKKLLFLLIIISFSSCKTSTSEENTQKDFITLFEKSKGTETPEYQQVIAYYKD